MLSTSARTYPQEEAELTLTHVKSAIHSEIWQLREKLNTPNRHGHTHHVPVWKLDCQVVCRAAFKKAVGGAEWAHREALRDVLMGRGPGDYIASKTAKKNARDLSHKSTKAHEFAVCWWKEHLRWHDWLPNEMAIQYRGPTWKMVHESAYLPKA